MGMEALQQSIIQRPNLVMGGIGAARNEADQRRLFEMQRQGQLVQGILQALGLWTDQQRFGANMRQRQYEFGVGEGTPVPGPDGEMIPPPRGFRAQAADQAGQRFEWDKAVEGDPGYQQNQREMQLQQLLGMTQSNEFGQRTMEPRVQMAQSQAEGAAQDNYQSGAQFRKDQEMWPLERQAAEQGLRANERSYEWASQDRPFDQRARAAQVEGMERVNAFQKEWDSAKTEDERNALAGRDFESWSNMQLMDKRVAAAAAGADPGPMRGDFILKELRDRSKTLENTLGSNRDEFGNVLDESQRAVNIKMLGAYKAAMEKALTDKPIGNESPEAQLGRLLREAWEVGAGVQSIGGAPNVAAPGSQAEAPTPGDGEDFSGIPRRG